MGETDYSSYAILYFQKNRKISAKLYGVNESCSLTLVGFADPGLGGDPGNANLWGRGGRCPLGVVLPGGCRAASSLSGWANPEEGPGLSLKELFSSQPAPWGSWPAKALELLEGRGGRLGGGPLMLLSFAKPPEGRTAQVANVALKTFEAAMTAMGITDDHIFYYPVYGARSSLHL